MAYSIDKNEASALGKPRREPFNFVGAHDENVRNGGLIDTKISPATPRSWPHTPAEGHSTPQLKSWPHIDAASFRLWHTFPQNAIHALVQNTAVILCKLM